MRKWNFCLWSAVLWLMLLLIFASTAEAQGLFPRLAARRAAVSSGFYGGVGNSCPGGICTAPSAVVSQRPAAAYQELVLPDGSVSYQVVPQAVYVPAARPVRRVILWRMW